MYIGQSIDYDSGPYTVQFNAGDTRVSFNVSVYDDNILERNETFNLLINTSSLPSGVTVDDPGQTTVTIVDNDGKYIYVTRFAKTQHNVARTEIHFIA